MDDVPDHVPTRPLSKLLITIAGQRLVPGHDDPNPFRYFADYEPLDPTVARKTIGTTVQLTTGASAQNAARQVRSARDDAYPLNPATIRVNGIAVYEGWTNNGPGASHFLTWVEP